MSFRKLQKRRRMCRRYLDKEIPRAILLSVLEAARRSPSAGHAQGFRVAVVRCPRKRQEIARLYGEEEYLSRGYAPWLSAAPVHLLIGASREAYRERYQEKDKSSSPETWPLPYPILDSGKSMMNLYLAATECGLGCGYLGPHAGPDLLRHFDLPEDWVFTGLVTLGYPDPQASSTTVSSRRGWRDFDEVVHWL